jgi:hypothetical protein
MAATTVSTTAVNPGKFVATKGLKTLYTVCIFLGILTLALGLLSKQEGATARMWHSYLTSYFYFTNFALGGLFWAAVNNVANAGWSVNVRRIGESLTAFLPLAAAGAIVLLLGSKNLYVWLDHHHVEQDYLLQAKHAYLNSTFFIVRLVAFFAMWMFFATKIVGNSIKQDATGEDKFTLKNIPLSVAFIVLFALSYSLFSVDLLMSLQPHWYSTIWGVYNFAGLFQSTMAVMILITLFCIKNGWVRGLVNENHVHDLAKYMKAFTIFYAYIGFSQFLLIWYANLPEETIFYLNRSHGGWMAMSFSLLIFKFAVPFILLLPRWAKRTPGYLSAVCALILVMQYVDIHWMVYPNLDNSEVLFGWQEIGIFLGFLGLFVLSVTRFLEKNNLIPVKDPRIQESLVHEVTY